MLSDKQKRTALKKNIARVRGMARQLLADGVEGITLTHYRRRRRQLNIGDN